MKLLPLVVGVSLVASSSLYSTPANAQADQLVSSICSYVANDDKSRLRKKLKETKVKLRNIYSGISCNGKNLLRHAMDSNANETGTYIVKKLPAGELAASGDVDWAGANGHGGSAIVAAIKDRAGI